MKTPKSFLSIFRWEQITWLIIQIEKKKENQKKVWRKNFSLHVDANSDQFSK